MSYPRWICRCAFLLAVLPCGIGCVVGPDYCRPPLVPVPASWRHLEAGEVTEGDSSRLADWWHVFDDPVLNALIDDARLRNLGLEEAAQRIWEARARRGTVRGDLFPLLTGDGNYTYQKLSTAGGFIGAFGTGQGRAFDSTMDQGGLGLSGSWEVDVFGRLRRLLEAADGDVEVSVWDYRDTTVILLADVATNYVDARTFQRRLRIAGDNLAAQLRSLELTEKRFRAGTTSELDVAQARANVRSTESEIPTLEIGYREAVNRLSVLTGQWPGAVDERMRREAPIPSTADEIVVGIPAELLRRRPDVREAEWQVAAQNARIGAAIAELYPQFSISGTFGVDASQATRLFTTNAIAASIGPAVNWNLLNFGRLRYNVEAQEALFAQNVTRYRQTVLQAAEEVDNALVAYRREKSRRQSLREAVTSYRRAVELSQKQYERGTTDFQRVLDSQRSQLQFEDLLALSQASVALDLIRLYRALGGGWEAREPPAVAPPPDRPFDERPEEIDLPPLERLDPPLPPPPSDEVSTRRGRTI